MFPAFMPLLIGAGIGALTNKKNPLLGAALGAGSGALGGLLTPAAAAAGAGASAAPGLLATGAEAAAPSMVNLGNSALLMNGAPNPALAPAPESAFSSIADFGKKMKPIMDIASPAMQMMNQESGQGAPVAHSPVMQPAGPNQSMNNLMSSINSTSQSRIDQDEARRELRRRLIRGM